MDTTEEKVKTALLALRDHLALNEGRPDELVPIHNYLAGYFVASIKSQGEALRTAYRQGQGLMKSRMISALKKMGAEPPQKGCHCGFCNVGRALAVLEIQDVPTAGT